MALVPRVPRTLPALAAVTATSRSYSSSGIDCSNGDASQVGHLTLNLGRCFWGPFLVARPKNPSGTSHPWSRRGRAQASARDTGAGFGQAPPLQSDHTPRLTQHQRSSCADIRDLPEAVSSLVCGTRSPWTRCGWGDGPGPGRRGGACCSL